MGALIQEKYFWQNVLTIPGILFTLATGFLSFFDWDKKEYLFYGLFISSVCLILYFLYRYSTIKGTNLILNDSNFEITIGDIFNQEEDDFKVIAFNEYFDTKVDGNIISPKSLNGQYITKFYPNQKELKELDDTIADDDKLKKKVKEKKVDRFNGGKTTSYNLGSIYKDGDYFLVAFSKFNEKDEANLKLSEYANCLINFWDEVNTLYNQQTVVLPLLGAGITRHSDFEAKDQELLEVLIWTFKISKVKFKEPAKVKVVIHELQKDNINFYQLKEGENIGV